MKPIAISCFLMVFQLMNVNAQCFNKIFFEEKVGYSILIDRCDRSGLEGPEFGEYFEKEYAAYKLDESSAEKLSKCTNELKIRIVLGTWCHDSQVQVPRFIKILDQINFNQKNLEIICVDRSKKTHGFSIQDLNIEFVPTIIFYKTEKEIGRIIETPKESLEKDFLTILK